MLSGSHMAMAGKRLGDPDVDVHEPGSPLPRPGSLALARRSARPFALRRSMSRSVHEDRTVTLNDSISG